VEFIQDENNNERTSKKFSSLVYKNGINGHDVERN